MVAWGANLVRLGGDWSSSGDQEGETLWLLFLNIFNAFLEDEPFPDNADLVLGGIVLARGAANIAHKLFGSHSGRESGGFLAHSHTPGGDGAPEIINSLNQPFSPIEADEGSQVKRSCPRCLQDGAAALIRANTQRCEQPTTPPDADYSPQ